MKALPTVRRRVVVSLVACAALLTSGCAVGQHARTAAEVPAIDGATATIGHLQVHEVALATPPNGTSYEKGDYGSLQFVAVNVGETDDQLTSITTTIASGAVIRDKLPSTAAPTATDSSSPAASPTAAPAAFTPIDIGAGSRVSFGVVSGDRVIVLVGLTKQLFGGNSISVTFTFAKAGSVTVVVPVQISTGQPGLTLTPTGTPEE